MEFGLKPQNHPRDPEYLGRAHQTAAPRTHLSSKLKDILTTEKATLSYADFHNQITKNETSVLPKTYRMQHNRGTQGIVQEDEMVRPVPRAQGYLEKGEGYQENALNVGVLDWRRLEKWRHNSSSNQRPHTGCSSSAHPTAYSKAADGSFSHSGKDQSTSPVSPRLRHPSLQSHLEASPKRASSSVKDTKRYGGRGRSSSPSRQRTYHLVPQSHHPKIYPSDTQLVNDRLLPGNARKSEDVSSSAAYDMIRQQSLYEIGRSFSECKSKARLDSRKKILFNVVTGSETEKTQSLGNCHVAPSLQKGKMIILESELRKEALQPKGHSANGAEPEKTGKSNRVTLLMPRGSKSRVLYSSTSETYSEQDPRQESFFENHESKEEQVGVSGHRPDVPYSCPLPVKDESNKRVSEIREPSSVDKHRSKVFPRSMRSASSPHRGGKYTEDNKPVVVHKCSGELKMSSESEKASATEPATTKTRNPSPIRRLSSAMGSIIRSAGSRESSPIRRSSSKEAVVQPGLGRVVSSSSADSPPDKSSHANNNRSRTSPLRRLLDPLLKPKTSSDDEPLKRSMASMSGPWKSSSHDQLKLLREQPTKVNTNVIDRRVTGLSSSHHMNPKQGSPAKHQALLQVAVKNGLPLFTFAVDGCSDLLAATLRKSSAAAGQEKTQQPSSRIYTFFTVQEIKKKNGLWLNHQGKKNGDNTGSNSNQGYIPNVVAQMKVSNPHSPVATWPKGGTHDDPVREYSLFSVDVSQMDHQHAVEFQPVNELAAIVVNLVDDDSSDLYCLPRGSSRYSECGGDSGEGGNSLKCRNGLNTTVILPGGVHTVPSKGSVSTLTQRWRSGGSCDCGGWDIGCQLRVFNHQGKLEKTSPNLSKATSDAAAVDEFQLLNQVGQENQLVLSLSPFKERIYSVEFDSSISILQAFAISVSVLDCRGSAISHDLIQAMAKAPPFRVDVGGAAVAALASCISYSPVGRA